MSKLGRRFLWGVSTSGHKIEGGNVFSDWYEWELGQNTVDGKTSRIACDSWNRMTRDISSLMSLGVNCYRFSVEWARVEPRQHRFDSSALQSYRSFTEELLREGILPVIALHNFVNPGWLSDLAGWENEDCLGYFRRYVERVVDSLGDLVKMWITLAEPNVYTEMAYNCGKWPPCINNRDRAHKVLNNFALAHSQAYSIIKSRFPRAAVSLSQGTLDHAPARKYNPLDRLAARSSSYSRNFRLLDTLSSKTLKEKSAQSIRSSAIQCCLDFIWINFRGCKSVRYGHHNTEVPGSLRHGKKPDRSYFQGLKRIIKEAHSRYSLPIILETSGIDGEDAVQLDFIDNISTLINDLAENKVALSGYLFHPMMDCFEWDLGYSVRTGLIRTDFETLALKPGKSAERYREIIKAHKRHYLLSRE